MSDVNPDLQIFKFYKRRQRLPQDDGKLYYRADGYMHGLFERRSVRELLKPFRVRHLMGGVFARAERDGFFEPVLGWTNPFHVGLHTCQS